MADNKVIIDIEARGNADVQIKKVTSAVEELGSKGNESFKKISGSLDSFTDSIANFITPITAVVGSAGALAFLVKGAFDAADSLIDLSENLGISTSKLQEFEFAASQNGISAQQFNSQLDKFSRLIGDAAQGSKTAIDAFGKIGVSVTDAAGKLKTTDELFVEVSEKIQRVGSQAEQAAVLTDLFGKSGVKLVQVFKDGPAGLAAYAEQARELGLVLDEDMVKKAAAANDKFDALSKAIKTQFIAVAIEAAPAVSILANALLSVASTANDAVGVFRGLALQIREATGGNVTQSEAVALLKNEIKLLEQQLEAAKNAQTGYSGEVARGNGQIAFFIQKEVEATEQIQKKKEALFELQNVTQSTSERAVASNVAEEAARGKAHEAAVKQHEEIIKQAESKTELLARQLEEQTLAFENELITVEQFELSKAAIKTQQKLLEDQQRAERISAIQAENALLIQIDADANAEKIAANEATIQELAQQNAKGQAAYQASLERQRQFELKQNQQKLAATATLFGGLGALARAGGKDTFELSKRLFQAQAIISGIAAVQYALANPPGPPFNAFIVAGVIASTIANVAQIEATKLATGITSVPPGFPNDSFPARLTSGERVVDANANSDLKMFLATNSNNSELLGAILTRLNRLENRTVVNIGGREIVNEIQQQIDSGRALTV